MDYTMCSNRDCDIRDHCYRAVGLPSTMQSWADFKEECYRDNGYAMCIPADDIETHEEKMRDFINSVL